MMRAGTAVTCGFLAMCLAACKGYADGKCTQESLRDGKKMPPELAALVGTGQGSGLANALCVPPEDAPWTIMFGDDVLQCTDKKGKRTCKVDAIGGVAFAVDSATAEPRVNTANVKLSKDVLRPLLDSSHVRFIAPNCMDIHVKAPLKADKPPQTARPMGVIVDIEPECERHDSAQWGLMDACVPASHEDASTPKIVAVLDSGIDCTHPAISSRIDGGSEPAEGHKCPASAGTNYFYEDRPPDHCKEAANGDLICETHGTGVAGVIASSAPEVPGADPRAKLVSMRVLREGSDLEFAQPWTKVATAILDSGKRAEIINVSASWGRNLPWLAAAIDRVTADHRHLVVGSTYTGTPYPAAFTKCNDAVIGVSDIGANPHQWPPYSWGTNSRDEAYMVAPGLAVLTSYSDENTLGSEASEPMYKLQSGSSFAAPHVSGAAALVWSTRGFENCTAEGIRKTLECSARITLIGKSEDARKRLHLGCLFSQRDLAICVGPQRCIESVKEEFCR